jgi:hypothetical protein
MNKTFTKEQLTSWIAGLQEAAKNDEQFLVDWFKRTKDSQFSIVGGWQDGFAPNEADLFCQSKSNPTYCMCVKICVNEGPYAYCDFETLDMPLSEDGEVDDNCIALEWHDDPAKVAEFFMIEWEQLMDTLKEDEEE